ncbi:MAG: hypothetical protein U0350_42195 [Caldilineaceae bacterium]
MSKQGGAFPVQQPTPTTFPEDPPETAPTTLLYNLSRYTLGGIPLINWMRWMLVIGAAIAATGLLPGRWWDVGICLLLLLGTFVALFRLRRHDFVTFQPAPMPAVTPQLLDTKQKIPVHATGLFTVAEKYQRYTWLPGFYRTFATHERALIGQVQDCNFWHISHWRETEIGLWYAFFMPDDVQQIQWGELRFGRTVRPALAITYRLNKSQKKRRNAAQVETLYLTVQKPEDGHAILADLRHDVPASVLMPAPAN